LKSGLKVYSFYRYSDVSDLILSKKSYLGFYIFNILAKNSLLKFAEEFAKIENFKDIYSIPIDDVVSEKGYSHTAILSNSMKENFQPLFNSLIAKNRVKYVGQSSKFRKENRRDFILRKDIVGKKIVLVDDVVTTGTTLSEAEKILKKRGNYPLFALTLATTERD
jgi:competence protein ComFC